MSDLLPGLDVVTDPDVLASLAHDDAEWAPVGPAGRGGPAADHRGGAADRRRLRRTGRAGGRPRRRHRPVRRRQRGGRLRRRSTCPG